MSQKTRIQKLEAISPASGMCILARSPSNWSGLEKSKAIKDFVSSQEIRAPFASDVQACPSQNAFEVYWFGDLEEALEAAAINPARIGVGR